jgi:hypothetical protein
MRFSRLKKQIEKSADESRTDSSAKAARPQTQKKTSGKSVTAPKSVVPSTKNYPCPAQALGPKKSIMMEAERRSLPCGRAAYPHVKKHVAFVDLTQESDSENDMRGADNSDEDLPLMKKRRTADSLGVPGLILDHVPIVVTGHGPKSNLSKMASVSQANGPSVSGNCAESAGRYNSPSHEQLRTAQNGATQNDVNVPGPTVVDLTNDSPIPTNSLPQPMPCIPNDGFVVPQDQSTDRRTFFQPTFTFENGVLWFGDESYDPFHGTGFDMQTAYGYHPTATPPFSSQFSSALPLVSQRARSLSVDERPAYSQALRVLDHPGLEAAHSPRQVLDLTSSRRSV